MVTIFGLGFTGTRVARRLLAGGRQVRAAVRDPLRFAALEAAGLQTSRWTLQDESPLLPHWEPGGVLLHSVPTLPAGSMDRLHRQIEVLNPERIVYISSTGVYGNQKHIDENSQPDPADERGMARVAEERWLAAGRWQTLILRAAAIYGPGRGVHTALREGRAPRGAGSGVVSRIHVDDLAALVAAGLESDLTGAWPVADELPCPSAEIIAWCADNYGLEQHPSPVSEFPVAGRIVDGTAIRVALGVELSYKTWRTGVPACIDEEDDQAAADG